MKHQPRVESNNHERKLTHKWLEGLREMNSNIRICTMKEIHTNLRSIGINLKIKHLPITPTPISIKIPFQTLITTKQDMKKVRYLEESLLSNSLRKIRKMKRKIILKMFRPHL